MSPNGRQWIFSLFSHRRYEPSARWFWIFIIARKECIYLCCRYFFYGDGEAYLYQLNEQVNLFEHNTSPDKLFSITSHIQQSYTEVSYSGHGFPSTSVKIWTWQFKLIPQDMNPFRIKVQVAILLFLVCSKITSD